jgi:UDP-2-acetamido-3-amino-2,3-dideoxy-glucuronate N-acetyltransferase
MGKGMKILHPKLSNIYCKDIGPGTIIGPFVEIQSGAKIGKRCKIQSHTFICAGVEIGNDCFIGHGVMFTNDLYPSAAGKWKLKKTKLADRVSIGSGAVILPVKIGKGAVIGAGSVVTKNVKAFKIVKGNPAC